MNTHLGEKPFGGDEKVGAIGQDWKQKRIRKAMAEVRGDTPSSLGQAADGGEGGL